MPIDYTIDAQSRLALIVGSGRLTDAEIVECASRFRSDPNLTPDMKTLTDLRSITVDFSRSGILEVISLMEKTQDQRSGARAAIVVDSEVSFGMSRVWEMRVHGQVDTRVRVFRDMTEAHKWLELNPLPP
ncbi:MAG: hypothetical protein CL908_11420 [Deltaproteobacteria bacterium]|jgi:hypothetical protein|nr:hypothetical protein [Deltaproteobacteria bacterium]